jgi:hypothetical protein
MKKPDFRPESEVIEELMGITGKLLKLVDEIPLEKFASGNEWMGMDRGCLDTSILIEGSREQLKTIAIQTEARKVYRKKKRCQMRRNRKK